MNKQKNALVETHGVAHSLQVAVSVAAFLFCSFAFAFPSLDESIASEETDMSSTDLASMRNVFFVRVFGGLMPVPNRFGVVASAVARHELTSPVLTEPRTAFLVGSIIIGRRDVSDDANAEFEKILHAAESTVSKGHFKIAFLPSSNPSNRPYASLRKFVLFNEREYVLVSDSNPKLWELLSHGLEISFSGPGVGR